MIVSSALREDAPEWPSAIARRDTFVEALVEAGTVAAARLMLYSAPLGNAQAKIVEIAPEGVVVSAGDLLVRFDANTLEQSLAKEQAALQQARADLTRADAELRLEQLRASTERDTARQQVTFAITELTNEEEGKGRVALAEAEAAAAEARREVERTKTAYEDLKPLLSEGFVTRAEMERAEQAWRRATEHERLAALKLSALTQYERPAAVDKARAAVESARQDLARTRESASARMTERQSAVTIARSRVDEIRARADMLSTQIAQTTMRAAGPGLVVYRELFFGGDRRKPQVGDEVFPNQPLIAVPDPTQLVIDTRVREVDLHKLSGQQRVEIYVDAYPGLRLTGTVALVGALAQADAARGGAKFFPVTVRLLGGDPRLRTGMTARVEIHVASTENAVVVPAQAVFDDAAGRVCFVLVSGEIQRRAIEVAGENETAVAIARGVSAGESVLLADPRPGK